MSQYPPAFNYVMDWEDPERQFAETPDDCPDGCEPPCMAISGINSGAWPKQYEIIAGASAADRPALVFSFYKANFWDRMMIGGLIDQDVTDRVMDQGVNGGTTSAVRILQRAANSLGAELTVDGVLGSLTREAVNELNPESMLAAYRAGRKAHYEKIVKRNPSLAIYLDGWLKRAAA